MSSENRKLRRYRALKSAQLVDARTGGYSECTVLDLTSTGARIRMRRMPNDLGKVELILLPEKVKVVAQTRWLRGNQCGLEFSKKLNYLSKHDMCAVTGNVPSVAINLPML